MARPGAVHAERGNETLAQRAFNRGAGREERREQRAADEGEDDGERNRRRPAPVSPARRGLDVGLGDGGDGHAHAEYLIFGLRYA